MSRKHEVYLISLALILIASIILYNVLNTPELDPAVINTTAGVSTVNESSNGNTDSESITNSTDLKSSSYIKSETTSIEKNSSIININTATAEELMTLEGIGEIKANSIISYRNENGNFSAIDEIMNVSGIGEKTFDKIKNNITV